MKKRFEVLEMPEPFFEATNAYWKDDYISQLTLYAHLNPHIEGGSRTFDFIEDSIEFIERIAPSSTHQQVIDLGCGPGLYCERMTRRNYEVMGIDFSDRFIDHAIQSAKEQGLNINYQTKNFLSFHENNQYDLALLLYHSYCTLNSSDRKRLMSNVHQSLKDGGLFLLDVDSEIFYTEFEETNHWTYNKEGGFWDSSPHLELNVKAKYDNRLTLEKNVVLTEDGKTKSHLLWNQTFTVESLKREAEEAGFKVKEVFSDITGKKYTEDSMSLAFVLEK